MAVSILFTNRSSSCYRPRSQTVVMAPCCVWRSWETSGMHPSDTSAASATGSWDTPSKTTGRTRWALRTREAPGSVLPRVHVLSSASFKCHVWLETSSLFSLLFKRKHFLQAWEDSSKVSFYSILGMRFFIFLTLILQVQYFFKLLFYIGL